MSRRFQFSLRALLLTMLVVALAVLPVAWIAELCRSWTLDEPTLILTIPSLPPVTIEIGGPPLVVPAPEDKMPVIPFGRQPYEPIEL
ncbi:MAG TPA: hypothetical protein VFI31_11430 [Pirellulales bacterium]|nr:hypothetical protein [Pirellulales bacterium]